MKGLIIRICKQMKNDRRSFAMIFIIPLVIITFLYFLLGESSVSMKVGLIGANDKVKSAFTDEVDIVDIGDNENVQDIIKDGEVNACVEFKKDGITIFLLEENSTYVSKISEIMSRVQTEQLNQVEVKTDYIYGSDLDTMFEKLIYVLLGVISFFLVFIMSGISFVRERTMGTLERLMLTPIKRSKVVLGYTIGFGILGGIQSIIILCYSHFILGVEFNGSIFNGIIIMVLLALAAVSMGEFISIFANSEFQVIQFIPIIIIPQMFYSGILSLDALPFNLDKLAYFMPIYYGCSGLKEILINGQGFGSIQTYVYMLIVFIVVFFGLNTLFLKKYRAI